MQNPTTFPIQNKLDFRRKALAWANTNRHFCFLNGNEHSYLYGTFPEVLAVGNADATNLVQPTQLETLNQLTNSNNWQFGFFRYDLLDSNINKTKGSFFNPETLVFLSENSVEIKSIHPPDLILELINQSEFENSEENKNPLFKNQIEKVDYVKKIEKLKQHINRGDIYQINFCIEFEAENAEIDPLLVYENLNNKSPMPFSGIFKSNADYIICCSPERYIKKKQDKIISQPIKGTSPRNSDPTLDLQSATTLNQSTKERAENTMIVDLVRNDLSRFCKSGSVEVEELCKVYSFQPVHQMVSTVTGLVEEGTKFSQILTDSYPMGSMTGAPKVRAMELIETYETRNRGLFSGSLGYIEPNGDFDFNVLIRSIFYYSANKTITYSVGSGITTLSEPENEFEECMLKASSIQQVLNN